MDIVFILLAFLLGRLIVPSTETPWHNGMTTAVTAADQPQSHSEVTLAQEEVRAPIPYDGVRNRALRQGVTGYKLLACQGQKTNKKWNPHGS